MIEGASKNMPFNVQAYNNITRIQEAKRKEQVNALEKLNDYQMTQYQQAQFREQQRWLVYIMMMQLMFKLNMWDALNQMRIRRSIDITV